MVVQINGELKITAEHIIDEAYNRGKNDAKREISLSGEYERAYQRGLDDAWDFILKILRTDWKDRHEAFNDDCMVLSDMLAKMSASEAMEKIKKYEQEHAPGCDNTEANCGECHRRYYCEASPDSCSYAKKAQAEPEQNPERYRVQRTIWFDSNPIIKTWKEETEQDNALDEAIAHCEEVAEEHEKYCPTPEGIKDPHKECAIEHRQLASWLRELKAYKAGCEGCKHLDHGEEIECYGCVRHYSKVTDRWETKE